MAASVRMMRQRRAGLAPSPSKELEWVRSQLDRPVRLPIKEQQQAESWVRQRSQPLRSERRRRREMAAVQQLAGDPTTYTHIDLPTGKRLYIPLQPGQDPSDAKNCSLAAINESNKGHKAVRAASEAAESARVRRAAAATLQASFKVKRLRRRRRQEQQEQQEQERRRRRQEQHQERQQEQEQEQERRQKEQERQQRQQQVLDGEEPPVVVMRGEVAQALSSAFVSEVLDAAVQLAVAEPSAGVGEGEADGVVLSLVVRALEEAIVLATAG
eukprot:SAG22_NODE_1426_length_4457_cov_8.244149_1_plen_271_part_00